MRAKRAARLPFRHGPLINYRSRRRHPIGPGQPVIGIDDLGVALTDLHAHGTDAIDFYTRKKTITSRFFSGGETGRFFVEAAD